jgi:hypothetical protein
MVSYYVSGIASRVVEIPDAELEGLSPEDRTAFIEQAVADHAASTPETRVWTIVVQ